MIGLKEQILSFLFSIIYGILVAFIYRKIYKYLYYSKSILCFFNSFLYCFIIILLFFKMMYIINNGVINIYFILIVGLSFTLFYKKYTQ